jgi:hypothetical protein
VAYVDSSVRADGSGSIGLRFADTNGGFISVRTYSWNGAGTNVTDDKGNVISTPAPSALITAVTNYNLAIQSLVVAAAGANKLIP